MILEVIDRKTAMQKVTEVKGVGYQEGRTGQLRKIAEIVLTQAYKVSTGFSDCGGRRAGSGSRSGHQ